MSIDGAAAAAAAGEHVDGEFPALIGTAILAAGFKMMPVWEGCFQDSGDGFDI